MRGIQYAVTVEFNLGACDCWVTRFRA